MPGISCSRLGRGGFAAHQAEPRQRRHQAAGIGMQRIARTARSTAASSTLRPAYITITRCAVSRDDAEVVGDQDHGGAEFALQVDDQFEDLRLHR